ncbi:substrate-binding domain-containing protein [Agrococcus sp. ARC_14]|uniref:substrate-binding domain-containing protein n=1 Tax=Agrococcus sp. ARC_14 TaxID=2919927 RepID=UPI001F064C09|nr:substrate-binding domain-containing protein [Agrococcus sp. ARC_14]MCH1883932.1 substrate-binding domain-containing protein [Agrococcus sp. ARC_14]
MRRNTLIATAGAAAVLLLAGCGAIDTGTNTSADPEEATLPESCSEEQPFIGVALPNLTNPYYVAMQRGFEEAGADAGFEVQVQIANDDDAQQLAQVQALLEQQPCALALNGVKSEPAAAIVAAANQAGVPVFTVNVGVDPESLEAQGASIMQYLGADNYAGGQQMAELVLADLGADAELNIGFVTEPDETPTVTRDQGFEDTITAGNPNAQIVASVDGNVQPDASLQATSELLSGNPDINVIFASTGPATYGALQALGDRTDVAVYGFCASELTIEAPYAGCVAQEPESYGRQVIEQIAGFIAGETPEAEILLPLKVFGEGETPAPGEVG